MNIDKIINKTIRNLKEVYKELGFDSKEISFNINEIEDGNTAFVILDAISIVNRNGLTYTEAIELKKSNDTSVKFQSHFKKHIEISESTLEKVAKDRLVCADIDSKQIYEMIITCLIESLIIHELRHLYQFKTMLFSLKDLDIVLNDENQTWKLLPSNHNQMIMEKDAIEYTYSKNSFTLIKDKTLNLLLSDINYYVGLYHLHDKCEERENQVCRCIDNLRNYVSEKYKNNY